MGRENSLRDRFCFWKVGLAFALWGSILVACTTLPPFPELPKDATPSYKAGHYFGCEWGFMEAGRDQYTSIYYKDVERLEEDAEYREGWEDGYAICFEEGSRYLQLMGGDCSC